jgi:hypothetical protein
MPIKFYDLEPGGKNDSHYLSENGVRIARFNDLAKAEAVRERFMRDVADELNRQEMHQHER